MSVKHVVGQLNSPLPVSFTLHRNGLMHKTQVDDSTRTEGQGCKGNGAIVVVVRSIENSHSRSFVHAHARQSETVRSTTYHSVSFPQQFRSSPTAPTPAPLEAMVRYCPNQKKTPRKSASLWGKACARRKGRRIHHISSDKAFV